MKPHYFFLFTGILTLVGCGDTDKGWLAPPSNHLTVIVANETSYPIQVALPRAYYNLADFSQVSTQPVDTLHLLMSEGFGFVRFSHRNTTGDTVFVGIGDTLRLTGRDDQILHEIQHWSDSFSRFEEAYNAFTSSNWYRNTTRELDSIKSVFFPIDTSIKPMRWSYDYSFALSRFLLKTDPSIFKEKHTDIQRYFQLSKLQHDSTVAFLKVHHEYPLPLIDAVRHRSEHDLFNRLMRFSTAPVPFPIDSVLSKSGADFYRQTHLLIHPNSISFLAQYINRILKPETNRTRGRVYTDYKPIYDDAPKYFDDSTAKFARFLSLEWMVETGEAFPEVEDRYQHFNVTYGDQHLTTILESKYLFDFKQYKDTVGDLKLMDVNRKILSLDNLINRSAGKLVYVDFWASWCSPCREVMPESRALNADYQNKDVVVVYISTDKDVDAWHAASKVEKLDEYPYSFLVLNQDKADFIKRIALKEIPRYLLFDKQGKLVHQDAPGPAGQDIRSLFAGHL